MDVKAQIDAVEREVEIREADGATTYAQSLAQTYPSPLADVWDAVTSAERIPRWFLPVTGDLRLGGSYQLQGNAGGEIRGCTPPADGRAEYTITWGMGGEPALVTVRLTEVDPEHTRVEIHNVIAADALPLGMWEQYGPGATGVGFELGMMGLGLHLTGDTSVTPETAEAWQVSDEGRDLTRRAVDAWADAQVASGASE
ncbi:MAG TPA: SRPBCC domain-containing protein, partial [Pseudolysinimonas sp.]|nr:SRPBCC domain-containing protein [Pseudolysinimonas sp.]